MSSHTAPTFVALPFFAHCPTKGKPSYEDQEATTGRPARPNGWLRGLPQKQIPSSPAFRKFCVNGVGEGLILVGVPAHDDDTGHPITYISVRNRLNFVRYATYWPGKFRLNEPRKRYAKQLPDYLEP